MPFEKGNKLGQGRPKGSKNRKNDIYKELYEDIVGTLKEGKHYVYYHYIGSELIYIGKGVNSRAWAFSNRKYNHADVRIICSNLKEEDALAIERELIKINRPKFNIDHAI
jgi:hypothetical protein